MLTSTALLSLAPVGRKISTTIARDFLSEGPGVEVLRRNRTGMGDLGIIPLIVGAVSAGATWYASDQEQQAQKELREHELEMAQIQSAQGGGDTFVFKTKAHQSAADRFGMAVQAVSGQTVHHTEDKSGLYISLGIGAVALVGIYLVMKGI